MPNRSAHEPAAGIGIEQVPEVLGMHHPEGSDSGERLSLRSVQLVRSAATTNELPFAALGQIQLSSEGMTGFIGAHVLAAATAARPAMSLRRGAPGAQIVVARIESIEHDTPHSGPALAPIRWRV